MYGVEFSRDLTFIFKLEYAHFSTKVRARVRKPSSAIHRQRFKGEPCWQILSVKGVPRIVAYTARRRKKIKSYTHRKSDGTFDYEFKVNVRIVWQSYFLKGRIRRRDRDRTHRVRTREKKNNVQIRVAVSIKTCPRCCRYTTRARSVINELFGYKPLYLNVK